MRSLFLLLVLALLASACHAHWCLNESGEAVDWWVAVKAPRLSSSQHSAVAAGRAYLYADSKSARTGTFWRNSSKTVMDADSAMGRTVGQIYATAGDPNYGYALYSDQTPDGTTSSSFGHAKGHMAWSSTTAFWFIHSVPRWAPEPGSEPGADRYSYPTSGHENGQSMMCVSIAPGSLDKVFAQLQHTNPLLYGSKWVSSLTARLPHGDALINKGTVVKDSATSVSDIYSAAGKKFTHLGKTAKWGQSIFGNLIGPYYGESLLAETWQRPYEEPLLPPESLERVYSVLNMAMPPGADWDGVTWKVTQDHSKWAIVRNPQLPVFCVGDLNKQRSQWKRAGGMLCINDKIIHAAFKSLILETDENGAPKFFFNETIALE